MIRPYRTHTRGTQATHTPAIPHDLWRGVHDTKLPLLVERTNVILYTPQDTRRSVSSRRMCSQARPGGVSRRRGGESTPITPHRTRIVPHARLVYGAILRSAQTRDAVRIRSRHYSGEDSALPATLLWSTGQDQVERAAPTLAEEVGPRDEPSGLGRKFGLALRAVRHVLAEDARGPAGDAALTTCGGGTSLIRGAGNRLGAPPSRAPSMSPSARRVITKKSRACRRSCPSGWPGEATRDHKGQGAASPTPPSLSTVPSSSVAFASPCTSLV